MGSLYKFVAKVLLTRLAEVMDKLVFSNKLKLLKERILIDEWLLLKS